MFHHLVSLPWPWLVGAGFVFGAASPELTRFVRHERDVMRRAQAFAPRNPRHQWDTANRTSSGPSAGVATSDSPDVLDDPFVHDTARGLELLDKALQRKAVS